MLMHINKIVGQKETYAHTRSGSCFAVQANLPVTFWGESVMTATYLINRTPTTQLSGKSPHELLFTERSSYKHIRVLGFCGTSTTILGRKTNLVLEVGDVFLQGILMVEKGGELQLRRGKFFDSRDVVFYEQIFPFMKKKNKLNHRTRISISTHCLGPMIGHRRMIKLKKSTKKTRHWKLFKEG